MSSERMSGAQKKLRSLREWLAGPTCCLAHPQPDIDAITGVLEEHADLLAACEALVVAANDHGANYTACIEAARLARAAIAKATGGEA